MRKYRIYQNSAQTISKITAHGIKSLSKASVNQSPLAGGNPGPQLNGNWHTTYGIVTLNNNKGSVTGSYTMDNGNIHGDYLNGDLSGFWVEDHARVKCAKAKYGRDYWGGIQWTFKDNNFNGKWGYCDEPLVHNWSGTRQ